jgi:hypothetical protein
MKQVTITLDYANAVLQYRGSTDSRVAETSRATTTGASTR